MATLNLKSLVGRLDDTCRRSLESAAGLCLSRTHYNIEIEHWLLKLLEEDGSDIVLLLRHAGVDPARLEHDLERSLDRAKTGNSRPPALSPNVVDLARESWLTASLDFGAGETRSGHLLLALLETDALARQAQDMSGLFADVSPDALRKEFDAVCGSSPEAHAASAASAAGGPSAGPAPSKGTKALDQFTVDLTEVARQGKVDPVLGRDSEIRQVIDILTRRRQNNPILTGEPGVGKTAVAEGFAQRVVSGDVPDALKNVSIRSLDLALLQAGAGVKGEFENRLKSVISEVKGSPQPIILFIDEAHTLIGAGGQSGQGDAANLLKPALARGELRTIAATTWAEYKKYFERDAALARRFQVVKVEEPSREVGLQIMRGLANVMEKHHGVRVLDEALEASVNLSSRYISGRHLPDKSVSVLDTACARVALSQSATPAPLEDCQRRIEKLETSLRILGREAATAPELASEIERATEEKAAAQSELEALQARWKRESELVEELRGLRRKLEGEPEAEGGEAPEPLAEAEREDLLERMRGLDADLTEVQGDHPLIYPFVDGQAVAEVIANWTGIPVGRMVSDEIKGVLELEDALRERVIGQDHALRALAERIRMSRANLTDPQRPIGVFMLVGTSGVGKTETAIAVAELLYGGEQNMTTINMSEFKEEHKVSLLMGSPPGYVGYGEGGVLTEAVRRKPYSVVLLDELEKAHPGVQDVFYNLFDKGTIKDGEGRDIDFRNTVILMTTNAGTDTIMSLWADPETMPDADGLAEALRPELLKTFKPAFLGRTTTLPYFPLGDEVMKGIVELKMKKVGNRVKEHYGATFTYTSGAVQAIRDRCTEVESGARNIDHILNRTLLPELAGEFLSCLADGRTITAVEVDVAPDGAFQYNLQASS